MWASVHSVVNSRRIVLRDELDSDVVQRKVDSIKSDERTDVPSSISIVAGVSASSGGDWGAGVAPVLVTDAGVAAAGVAAAAGLVADAGPAGEAADFGGVFGDFGDFADLGEPVGGLAVALGVESAMIIGD